MTIQTALDWRYATGRFSDHTIPQHTLQELLEATCKSPSSYGLQPYKIKVVNDRKIREALLEASYGQEKVRDSSHLIVFAAETHIGNHTVDRYIERIMKIRQLTFSDIKGYAEHMKEALEQYSPSQRITWAQQQVYIALGVFLTSAALMRIDACPMTGFEVDAYDRILALPEQGLTSTVIAATGQRHSEDQGATEKKVRQRFSDLVEFL